MTITQVITALPTAPDPATMTRDQFSTAAAAFVLAQKAEVTELNTWATQANAVAVAMNLNSTTDTSSTSNTIGTGSKTFTVTAGKSFQPGMWLVVADTAAPSTNSMFVQVTSYSGTSLVVNSVDYLGSGTKTAWTISQSAPAASDMALTDYTPTVTTSTGGATWGSPTITTAKYKKWGKLIFMQLRVLASVGSGSPTDFIVSLPASTTLVASTQSTAATVLDNGTRLAGRLITAASGTSITFDKYTGAAFTGNCGIDICVVLAIA